MLEMRSLGNLRNPGSQSTMSKTSHQTALHAGAKRQEVFILNNNYVIAQAI